MVPGGGIDDRGKAASRPWLPFAQIVRGASDEAAAEKIAEEELPFGATRQTVVDNLLLAVGPQPAATSTGRCKRRHHTIARFRFGVTMRSSFYSASHRSLVSFPSQVPSPMSLTKHWAEILRPPTDNST